MRIKFQHWIVSVCTVLILLLTAVFMVLVFGQFQGLAISSAQEKFNLIADKVFHQLEESLQAEKRFVEILSTSDVGLPEPANAFADAEILLPTVSRALQSVPTRYSAYFGFPNDDLLQVIAVRSNPAIEADLYAPPGTFEAYRTVRGNLHTESWSFRDQDGRVLGERTTPTTYRPSQRVWYTQAKNTKEVQVSAPYIFASIATQGLTFSASTRNGTAVFGSDITLTAFNDIINRLELSPHATVLVTDEKLRVLAKRKGSALYGDIPPGHIVSLGDLSNKYLKAVADLGHPSGDLLAKTIPLAGEDFMLTSRLVTPVPGTSYRIYVIAPLSDFTGIVLKTRQNVLWAALAAIVLLIPLAYLGTRGVTRSLTALTRQSERIRQLDFSTKPERVPSRLYEVHVLSRAQEVMHDSLKERTEALEAATHKLTRLVDIGIKLGREKDKNRLLKDVLLGARDIAHCQSAILYLKTDHQTLRLTMLTDDIPMPELELPLRDEHTAEPCRRFASADAVWNGKTVVVDDVSSDKRFDFAETMKLTQTSGPHLMSVLTLPLSAREGEVLGVLQLTNALDPKTGQLSRFDSDTVKYAEALAAQAAVIIENQNLLQTQGDLMDSMIKIIAGAIDAKSAYTGGHCERVPELAVMLAEEAVKVDHGPLADFSFRNEDEWQEFRIGAWLHDCGKVTTPEYVVDKATKLETIYNRIHEIRTRFEVLLRDAMLERLESIWERGVPRSQADAIFEQRQAQLLADYAFVAESNVGAEFMAPESIERIAAIGSMTWWRHFDDRLGLSQDEEKRLSNLPAPTLPNEERLLADKPQHIVARTADNILDPKYGFQVNVPQHLYNQGEVYNLSISRGTLTQEERFKINEHIIQTVIMLDNMPFPKHLKRVPEYASTHHETLIGTGYPRKLAEKDLSVPSRIMAIADIFEALTACDRPYKKAKTLSEAIKILSFFKKDKHIDPVLFDLFLTSGVYRRYAERFLLPQQMDEVDVAAYVTHI